QALPLLVFTLDSMESRRSPRRLGASSLAVFSSAVAHSRSASVRASFAWRGSRRMRRSAFFSPRSRLPTGLPRLAVRTQVRAWFGRLERRQNLVRDSAPPQFVPAPHISSGQQIDDVRHVSAVLLGDDPFRCAGLTEPGPHWTDQDPSDSAAPQSIVSAGLSVYVSGSVQHACNPAHRTLTDATPAPNRAASRSRCQSVSRMSPAQASVS